MGKIAVGAGLVLMGGSMVGVAASALTASSIVWTPPVRTPSTETVANDVTDTVSAAQNWARTAYQGGLRRCPAINESFLAACEAEMKAIAARPDVSPGSYGGPLLITEVEAEPPLPKLRPYVPESSEGQHISYDDDGADLAEAPDDNPPSDAPWYH